VTSVREIQEAVASDFSVPLSLLNSPARQQAVAWPRQYAMLLAREITGHSLPNIGRFFNRDHSTVIHGIDAAKERVSQDRNLALKLEARKLLLECQPRPDPMLRILRRIDDPSARKTVIMSKWARGEITPDKAARLIREGGLVHA
jgi:hypothetical protein